MRNKKRKDKRHIPPAAKTAAQPEKLPRVGENIDFWNRRPVWSFSQLDFYAEVGGWIHLQQTDLDELLARFRRWETMTWKEILSEGRKQNHSIDVSKCINKAQERLEVLRLDDLEELMSLRVNSTARVIGILDREVFRILWWDPRAQGMSLLSQEHLKPRRLSGLTSPLPSSTIASGPLYGRSPGVVRA